MSLILDALNRADKERSAQELAPNLHPSPLPATTAVRSLSRQLLVGLLFIFLAALVFFAQFEGIQDKANGNLIAIPAAVPITSAPAVKFSGTSSSQSAIAATTVEEVATSSPQSNPVILNLYQQQMAQTDQKAKPSTPASTKKPVRDIDDGKAILQQIPLLATMPARFQRSVPSIEYSVHVYNEEERNGTVNLNGDMRRVGAEIAPGLRVTAILSDSVVLDYNGTHFRLLALNSWVNFP